MTLLIFLELPGLQLPGHLGELEKEGYIEAKGKNIRIIDKEGLADLTVD